jgi:DNA-binding IclR family transcriptional regulator
MMLWAWDDAPVDNPTDALIVLTLGDLANDEGTGIFPSMERLSHQTRLPVEELRERLRALQARGLLELQPDFGIFTIGAGL